MNFCKTLTCFIVLMFFIGTEDVKASHAMAVDITYECLGSNKYYFCVSFYRDCNGVSAPGSVMLNLSSASCGQNFTQTLNMTSGGGIEVSQLCPSQINLSTCGTGQYAGVELYTYCDTVTLPANCPDWVISYDICCRNDLIDNLTTPSSQSVYIEVNLDNSNGICNNSVTYSSYPVLYGCAGNNMCFNHGAIDIDGDSLAFSLVDPMDMANTPISFVTGLGYSLQNPILSSTGFTFDPITGQMCWNATGPQECVISMKVEEWRMINGVPTLVGTSIREMQVIIMACTTSQPALSGGLNNIVGGVMTNSTTLQICPGDTLMFDMLYTDPDTASNLTLTSNNALVAPGSILTQTGTDDTIQATFTWFVPATYVGQNVITFEISNDACLVPGKNYYAYNIYVLEGTSAGPDQVHCENGVPVQLDATGGNQFVWTPANFLSNPNISNPIASPDSTMYFVVTSDLLGTCGNTDTVLVTVAPTYLLDIGDDTSICLNELYPMYPFVGLVDSNMSYDWSPSTGLDNVNTKDVVLDPVSSITYYLHTTSAAGCEKLDSIIIGVAGASPIPNLIASDDSICVGEIVNLDAMGEPSVCGPNPAGCQGSQTQIGITNGTTDNMITTPYNGFYQDNRVQYLYKASELVNAGFIKGGTITSLGFDISQKMSNAPFDNFTIKMGCTSSNSVSSFVGGLDVVYTNSVTTSTGWNDYTLDTPYDWDGSSNILVEVCYDNSAFVFSSMDMVKSYYTGYISVIYASNNGSSGCGLTSGILDNQRPNIRMNACFPSSGTYTYTWNPSTFLDDGTIQTPTSTPQSDITYYVTITDGGICDTEDSITISTRAPLVTTISADTTMCFGESYSISATGGDIYTWTPNSGLTDPNVSSPTASPSDTVVYVVEIMDAIYGCKVYKNVTVNINHLPLPAFAVDTVCLEEFSQFINNSQGVSGNIVEWHWGWGDGNDYVSTTDENLVQYGYAVAGLKNITLTVVDANGCVNTYNGSAYVKNKPVADFSVNPSTLEILVNAQMDIADASTGSISWLYYFGQLGQGDMSTDSDPSYTFTERGKYSVYQIVTNDEGCKDTIFYEIDAIEDPQLSAPTAFSPNEDGVNDVIYAKALGANLNHPDNSFNFRIFNRWGKLIFETTNINNGWDGSYNGKEQPVGTYVYVIEGNTPEEQVMIKGNISLLR